jgi:mycothiol synthase
MRVVEIARPPDTALRTLASALVDDIEHATGVPALSDHLRLDLNGAGDSGPLVVACRDAGRLIGFAQVSGANDTGVLEVVVDPSIDDLVTVRDDLAETAVDAQRRTGGDPIVWWLDDPTDHDHAVAEQLGLAPTRELFEMRRALPHPHRAEIATRDFVPGDDDEAWLRVNNRAFAEHGEQGGWTIDTLRLRQAEPWFDPAGFRIHEVDGAVLGFCWTKLHTDVDPVIGEIYVIAVDPSAHGRGLGKQLTLAGLDSIADRGVTVANLYVDAGNTAAVSLYERLGFHVHRRRLAFGAPT